MVTSSRRKPCFFKVLMPGFLEKLEIPRAFLKHIIPEKHLNITILSPLEKEFFVKIEGDYPNLYFGEGWQYFAEVHDLDVGYFLVFCYEGRMDFTVIILDTSSCQKEYAHLNAKEGIPWQSFEKDVDMMKGDAELKAKRKICDLNVTNLVEQKQASNTEKQGGECDHVKMKNSRKVQTDTDIKKMHSNSQSPYVSVEGESESDISTCTKSRRHNNEIQHIEKQANYAGGTSETLRSSCVQKVQTSCRIMMRRRNLEGHYYIYIPVVFKEATGIMGKHELILRDQNGKWWQVEVLHSTKNRTFFVRGWKEFCISHKLRPGDECEFHLAPYSKNGKKVMKVQIFKLSKMQRLEALEVKKTCGTDIAAPSFWVTMSSNKIRTKQIAIPNAFSAATNMYDKQEVIFKDQKNREFRIGVTVCTRNRTFFGRGWRDFASRNKLEEGDVCTFSLSRDSDDNWIFHVEVSRQPT